MLRCCKACCSCMQLSLHMDHARPRMPEKSDSFSYSHMSILPFCISVRIFCEVAELPTAKEMKDHSMV